MLIVIQRVTHARVDIDGETVGKIDQGLLVLCGFEPDDTEHNLNKMLDKCIHYRIFNDN